MIASQDLELPIWSCEYFTPYKDEANMLPSIDFIYRILSDKSKITSSAVEVTAK